MKKNKYFSKNQKKISKAYGFGLGTDASNWEEMTRHMSGYSPRPVISSGGMGSYDLSNLNSRSQAQELGKAVLGSIQSIQTHANQKDIENAKNKIWGLKLTPKQFDQVTAHISGYNPNANVMPSAKKEVKAITDQIVHAPTKVLNKINQLLQNNDVQITEKTIRDSFNSKTISNIINTSGTIKEIKNKIQTGVKLASTYYKDLPKQ